MTANNLTLAASQLWVSYGKKPILKDLDFRIPPGEFTIIVGPNGCGKSTLLRSLGRSLTPQRGRVTLDNVDIYRSSGKSFARNVSLLAQSPIAPGAITVLDLVSRGRYPYQSLLRQWSSADERAVTRALTMVGIESLADRQVEELSGGQRQRVWIAMALAQETEVVLLDEPTTFLDLSHQIEVLDLCAQLHREGRTVVAVLHDLNLAARYATHMVVMADGEIYSQGQPDAILTQTLIKEVFSLDARIIRDPETNTPLIIPRATTPTPSRKESIRV